MTDTNPMTPEQLSHLSDGELKAQMEECFTELRCNRATREDRARFAVLLLDEWQVRPSFVLAPGSTSEHATSVIRREVARLFEETDLVAVMPPARTETQRRITERVARLCVGRVDSAAPLGFTVTRVARTDEMQRLLIERVRRLCVWYEAEFDDWVRDVYGMTSDGRAFYWTCLRAA